MTGHKTGHKVLGSLCAGLALVIAVRTSDKTVQATASIVGSSLFGYTITTTILDRKRRRKNRLADATAYLEFLRQLNQERLAEKPVMPATCRGCQFYHGQTYGGNLLVCAMHPYGVEESSCPDWESSS